jgi:hypothetical protein
MKTPRLPAIAPWFFAAALTLSLPYFGELPAFAGPEDPTGRIFAPDVIETTVRELYTLVGNQSKGEETSEAPVLSADDLNILCDGLGQQVAAQKPEAFNDIVGHLLADWRQHVRHRSVIEAVLGAARAHAAHELAEQRSKPRPFDPNLSNGERAGVIALEAIDQTMNVFTLLYTFEFGRGLWKSRGQGLTKLEFFKTSLRQASEASLKKRGLLVGGSALTTVVKVAYLQLETRKMDPREELLKVRIQRVHDIAVRVVQIRDRLLSNKTTLEEIQALGKESVELLPEVQGILKAAPDLTRKLEPIAEDLSEVQGLLAKLGFEPDYLELGAGSVVP